MRVDATRKFAALSPGPGFLAVTTLHLDDVVSDELRAGPRGVLILGAVAEDQLITGIRVVADEIQSRRAVRFRHRCRPASPTPQTSRV